MDAVADADRGGANLDDPAAAVLRDDVKRETAPYELKGYLAIK